MLRHVLLPHSLTFTLDISTSCCCKHRKSSAQTVLNVPNWAVSRKIFFYVKNIFKSACHGASSYSDMTVWKLISSGWQEYGVVEETFDMQSWPDPITTLRRERTTNIRWYCSAPLDNDGDRMYEGWRRIWMLSSHYVIMMWRGVSVFEKLFVSEWFWNWDSVTLLLSSSVSALQETMKVWVWEILNEISSLLRNQEIVIYTFYTVKWMFWNGAMQSIVKIVWQNELTMIEKWSQLISLLHKQLRVVLNPCS